MKKSFTYQKLDLRNAVGIAVGLLLLAVSAIPVILYKGVIYWPAIIGAVLFYTFPKVLWPKFSSRMSCFYGVGEYEISPNHLVVFMNGRTYDFNNIDELYLSGAQEGGGAMLGGVTVFDGSLDIKEGKKKLSIYTSNMYTKVTEVEHSVTEMYEDIKDNFRELHSVKMDNGTEIRGYLKKG